MSEIYPTVQDNEPIAIESATELAKRAYALGKLEAAVSYYAMALELMTEKHGENSPESADLLFAYGKTLLENAVSQSAVLAQEKEANGEDEEGEVVKEKASRFHFGGDEEEDGEKVLDLRNDLSEDESEGEQEEDKNDSPEDDFNAAWEVLDLARAFYQKKDDEESRLKLADCYVALGDVSLETEKFEQAISDYTSALNLKTELLPLHHRQIAEAHWKLSMVLDLTSGRLGDAVEHVEKAIASVVSRLRVLRDGVQGELPEPARADPKGKGKATVVGIQIGDPIASLTKEQMEKEISEFEELKGELQLKLDDLRMAPEKAEEMSAPALAAAQLTKELGGPSGTSLTNAQINDLTGMVKKKKKVPDVAPGPDDSSSSGKRKAEETPASGNLPDKKHKLNDGRT
ncbi:uncharacterized protein EI90DRAFT_3125261 [Cantharellus anzutake]|uniref:uncharacterized protein n=1 Tax=Cantharellus anzutake TaxID=1750568 RepID=UPI0019044F88|nr:uncharacterized protein EI90DRAFT_3125261 [Cantharellus anzutake]KAF8329501.1 hypothetical protein EI90DRAFT_3125261 [Cantharellus anzutake]